MGQQEGRMGQQAMLPSLHRCRGSMRVCRLLTPVLRGQRTAVQGHVGDPATAGPADHCRYGPPPPSSLLLSLGNTQQRT